MSENIQIVLSGALDVPEVGDDSKSVFTCHNPPNMSVLDAVAAKLADFASKLVAS
jgi:hypothetical protein